MEVNSSESLVERNSERESPQIESQLSQLLDQTRAGEQSQRQSSNPSIISHNTDLEEGDRLDQLVLSYGLDRLVDDKTFLDIYLELHALCSKTDLSIHFIDLHEVEGRARWLLGNVEFLGIDMHGNKYDVQDFYVAFRRLREEREQ